MLLYVGHDTARLSGVVVLGGAWSPHRIDGDRWRLLDLTIETPVNTGLRDQMRSRRRRVLDAHNGTRTWLSGRDIYDLALGYRTSEGGLGSESRDRTDGQEAHRNPAKEEALVSSKSDGGPARRGCTRLFRLTNRSQRINL